MNAVRISFGHFELESRSFSKKENVFQCLSECEKGSVLLGENAKQELEFFAIIVCLDFTGVTTFGIGIISEGHGIAPRLLPLEGTGKILCGFNNEAVCVDLNEQAVDYRHQLDSVFRSFVHLHEHRMILVFHEIGVLALRENGNQIWAFSTDIIENCRIVGQTLHLQFMDAPSVTLGLFSGQVT